MLLFLRISIVLYFIKILSVPVKSNVLSYCVHKKLSYGVLGRKMK